MLLSSALLLLLVLPYSPAEAEQEQVIFAQPGNSVTIPRTKWESTMGISADDLYVNWYISTNTEALVRKTPGSSPKAGTQLNWKDRVSFSGDFSLLISPVLEHDFGIFICEQYKFIEKKETLYKLYKVIMPNTLTLIAGDSLSLSCEVKPSPVRPTIKWIVPQSISDDSGININKNTVHVKDVSDKHSGLWICSVIHDGHTLNATTAVTIIDLSTSPPDPIYTSITSSPPSIPCSLPSDISWSVLNSSGLQGGSWRFTPYNSSDPPRPLLTLNLTPPSWKVSNEKDSILEKKTLNNHDLSVKSSHASVNNRGTYTCSLHFKGGKTLSRRVQLEVLEVLSSNSSTTEGNTVNLTCTLGSPLPSDLQVQWIHPQKNLIIPGNHPTHLSIPAVRVQDSGEWKCELRKNQKLLTSAVIALKIEKGPVDTWLIVALSSAAFIVMLLPLITIIIVRRRRQQCMKRRQRKTRFCCCKKARVSTRPEKTFVHHHKSISNQRWTPLS